MVCLLQHVKSLDDLHPRGKRLTNAVYQLSTQLLGHFLSLFDQFSALFCQAQPSSTLSYPYHGPSYEGQSPKQ